MLKLLKKRATNKRNSYQKIFVEAQYAEITSYMGKQSYIPLGHERLIFKDGYILGPCYLLLCNKSPYNLVTYNSSHCIIISHSLVG